MTYRKNILFAFIVLSSVLSWNSAMAQTASGTSDAYSIINATNNAAISNGRGPGLIGSDNPPDQDNNGVTLSMGCSTRNSRAIPPHDLLVLSRWHCRASMTCSCDATYIENNQSKRCTGFPMSSLMTGTGAAYNRTTCINEADADLDAQRDAFFAQCQAAAANCPP